MLKQDVIDIFQKLGFKLINHPSLGQLIELNAKDAFIFSSIVGAPYMLDQNGITMKGRAEVFVHRSVFQKGYYIYSPGLFSRDLEMKLTEGNSADFLGNSHPSIFIGNKYIYIYDIENGKSSNVEQDAHRLISKHENPSAFILFKNFQSGSAAESWYEYLASKYYINHGFLVENQVPWFQQSFQYKSKYLNGGIPDFSAFHSNISNYLYKYGIINKTEGIPVNILPVIKNFMPRLEERKTTDDGYKYKLIIGEVKSSKNSSPAAITQLKKYNDAELASELYSIIPDLKDNHSNDFGEMFIENNKMNLNESKSKVITNNEHQAIDASWADNYIKMLLLGNVQFNEILTFITDFRKKTHQNLFEEYEAHHLLDAVLGTNNEDFFDFLITHY